MANIIEVRNTISTFGLLDIQTSMSSPLQLPMNNAPVKMQVCSLTLSDRIPNVFNANPIFQFNNTLCRVSTNISPWYQVQIPTGLYTDAESIGIAIAAALGPHNDGLGPNWWLNDNDPGIVFESNPITDAITISLIPQKLKPPIGAALILDLQKTSTGTDLATTLGFSQGTALIATVGIAPIKASSNQEVRMDTQGTTADVQCSLVTSRRRNDQFVKTIALVVFAGKTTLSDNVWPLGGQISPILVYDGNRVINNVEVKIKTLEGKPMFFMSGSLHLVVSFLY